MAKLTRSGIAYNLKDSPHSLSKDYDDGVITYVFSSDLYKRMFAEKVEKNREEINTSLTNRFGFIIKNDKLCDIKLYLSIEKRGFLLLVDDVEIQSANMLKLVGTSVIKQEVIPEWKKEVTKIEELRQAGVITEEESAIMKARLIPYI